MNISKTDLRQLCANVLRAAINVRWVQEPPGDPNVWRCNFCGDSIEDNSMQLRNYGDIEHRPGCAVRTAKRLMKATGIDCD